MYQMDEYTVSLLHFDGGIKDEAGKVWTPVNGATVSTSGSLFLNGSQYLSTSNSTDIDFGAGDFTIDWWEYRTAAPTGYGTVFCRGNTVVSSPYMIVAPSGNEGFWGSSKSEVWRNSDYDIALGAPLGTCDLNKWNHFAVARQGTQFYLFKNGALQSTFTSALSFGIVDSKPLIGKDRDNETYFVGYIDEFRVSKGIARWTGDFQPGNQPADPTAPTPPAPTGNVLLRVIMSDSSERDYQLPTAEIDAFVNWFMKHTSTDTAGYMLTKKVGTQSSKEYLTFDKIISFEVLELN